MKKRLIIPVVIVIGLLVLMFGLPKNPFAREAVLFEIEKGETSKDIAGNLQERGIIWWSPLFRVYVLATGVSGQLQAGLYEVSPAMNLVQIAGKMARGQVVKREITVIEGWTLKDIGLYLESKGIVKAEDLYQNRVGLEGYFFPDTYQIGKEVTLDEIVQQALDNFAKKTAGLEINSEIVVMASLLEKEVKTKEEKELAADVLWKRLKIGMPLQVDAWPQTYEKAGLPARPICNPGLESILAALNPQESPYWYYLAKPDGETIFSKTLEEHNINKAKYLK